VELNSLSDQHITNSKSDVKLSLNVLLVAPVHIKSWKHYKNTPKTMAI
jgi:hypothetical protein